MLCGYPPFFSRKKTLSSFEILQRITETNKAGSGVPFPDAQWQHVSKEAKALVNGLMTIDPSRRLTTSGVRKHPWIKEHEPGQRLSRRDSALLTPSVLQIGVLGDVDYLSMNRKRRRSRGHFNDSVNHFQRASRQHVSKKKHFVKLSTHPPSLECATRTLLGCCQSCCCPPQRGAVHTVLLLYFLCFVLCFVG